MDRNSGETPFAAAGHRPAGSRPAAPRPAASWEARQPDLDLERLVWDPEYREAVRARLRPLG
jgi:hypothetical protein